MEPTVDRLVRKVVAVVLIDCPDDHREDVESQILAEYQYAVVKQQNAGQPIQSPAALARKIAKRKIAEHLRRRSHHDLRFEMVSEQASVSDDWTNEVELDLAVQQELIALARRHPRAAEAFLMMIRGMNVVIIAAKMAVATSTVYRWIHIAADALQLALKHQS